MTLCVTRRFCDVSDVCLRLKAPFRPSATYFDGAKVGKAPGSVSGPTASGSFALSLIRGSPQRAIPGPVRLTRHPCRVTPGSAPGLSRHLRRTLRRQCHCDRKALLTLVPTLRVGMQFVTLRVTRRFCDVSDVCLRLKAPFRLRRQRHRSKNAFDSRADAPRWHAVRDALRHTAVLRNQMGWGSTQVTFSPLGELL